jgi:putative ABC transport system permease protein
MRTLLSSLRLALRALGRSRLRSALTTLGILIGIAAVVVVVAIGEGAREQVGARIESLGSNVVYVFSRRVPRSGARLAAGSHGVTLDDAEAIRREVGSIRSVTVYSNTRRQVITEFGNADTGIIGADGFYLEVRGFDVLTGRAWTPAEEQSKARVCLIGPTAADKLFAGRDPVGRALRIGKHAYQVIGTLAPKGTSPFGDDQDDRLLMPIGAYAARIAPEMGRRVQIVMASALSAAHTEQATAQIEELLRQRHRIGPDDEADFRLGSQQEFRQTQDRMLDVITVLLVSVAFVSLFVGGVGVMNIMLVGVTERRREIGIRMAIGARRRDIEVQFLIEALVLTLLGGVAGLALAVGVIVALHRTLEWEMRLSPEAVLAALATSLIVGLVFGILPARRAARLEPMEALRHE